MSAWKVLGMARQTWERMPQAAYSTTYSLEMNDADFMAMTVVQDELCRTETELEQSGLNILIVKDGETCWSRLSRPGATNEMVFKTTKNYYLGLYHPLYRMMTLQDGYHDPMEPDEVVRILTDVYDMKCKGTTSWKGAEAYLLKGVMKPSFVSGKDERDKAFLDLIKHARVLIEEDTFYLLHLDFFGESLDKPFYVRDFFDYDADYPVSEKTFAYHPSENASIMDLVTNEYTPAKGETIEEIEEVQEVSFAHRLLAKSEEKFLACESVEYDIKQTLAMGGFPMELAGKYRGTGDKARLELKHKHSGVGILKVSDGDTCWTEVPATFGGGKKIVYKSPADSGLAFSRVSLELGYIPRDYDLDYKGVTQWKGMPVHLLEGKNKPSHSSEEAAMGKARLLLHEDSLFLAGAEILDEDGLTFTITCTDYKTDVSIPEEAFRYEPPKGAVVRNIESLSRKQLLLPDILEKPALPHSESTYFQDVPEDSRLEVVLHEDGSLTAWEGSSLSLANAVGLSEADGFFDTKTCRYPTVEYLHGLMQYAADLFGRTEDDLADVDLVLYAGSDVPLEYLLNLIQTGASDPYRIYRLHFPVRDEKTGKNGFLSYYLPALQFAGDPLPGEYPDGWHKVYLYYTPSGPYYELRRADGRGGEKRFESLAELEKALDDLKTADPEVKFQMALGGIALETPKVNKKVQVQHLIDLMTLLSSRGSDLTYNKEWRLRR